MPNQTGKNVVVAFKVEATTGVAATGAGGTEFRKNAGSGIQLTRATINPNEVRSDGKMSMGRLGSKSVAGTLGGDLSVGTFDDLLQGGIRGTWATALTVTQATSTLTSITSNATSFVASAGSWVAAGFRVGDVFRVSSGPVAGNLNRNLRVTAVSTNVLAVAETLIVEATAVSTFSMVRGKKLVQPTSPVNRSFTIDEYLADLDLSKRSVGCRVSSLKVTGQPDGMAILEVGFVGMDQTTLSTASSPSLTSPTLTSTVALTWLDASIKVGAGNRTDLTSFEFTFDLTASGVPVIGSVVTPDVFPNNAMLSGSMSALVSDFVDFDGFINETEFEFHALLVEPTGTPPSYISFFLPRLKRTSYDTPMGGDGAMIATQSFMSGTKGAATGYDDTMISIVTSAV
jgi:hypothetical protein